MNMEPLYRFVDVRCNGVERTLTFTLHAGEKRLLQMSDRDEKNTIIDCALGEQACERGSIEIAQGERRHHPHAQRILGEKRESEAPIPLLWQPLSACRPERIGWVAANGGLISNLRIWENVTLPQWYHSGHERERTEQSVLHWLAALGVEDGAYETFMTAQPHVLELWQRKMAGLLRALLQEPEVMVVDAALLGNVKEQYAANWMQALDAFATEGGTVLMVADKATALQWERIE